MSDWNLFDLNGPPSHIEPHPSHPILIFSIDCTLIHWSLHTSQKIDIRCHQSPITSLTFSPNGSYLLSSELSPLPVLILFSSSLALLDSISLESPASSIFCKFFRDLIIICTSSDSSYSFTLLRISQEKLVIEKANLVSEKAKCLDFLVSRSSLLVLEDMSVKFYDSQSWEVLKIFNLNIVAQKLSFCEKLQYFVLLLKNNSVIIINSQGVNIWVLSKPAFILTTLATNKDTLFIGTSEGVILQINLNNFNVKEISLSNFTQVIDLKPVFGGLSVQFEDGTFQILRLSDSKVLHQLSSHNKKIRRIRWVNSSKFLSTSKETFLYDWKRIPSGWSMKALLLDDQLKLKNFDISSNKQFLACSFSGGVIRVYKTETYTLLEELRIDSTESIFLSFTEVNHYLLTAFRSGIFAGFNSLFQESLEIRSKHIGEGCLIRTKEVFKSGQVFLFVGICDNLSSFDLQVFLSSKKKLERVNTKRFGVKGKCVDFLFHASGNYLVLACKNCTVVLWKIESNEMVGVFRLDFVPRCLEIDGSGLYVCVGMNSKKTGKVCVFEIGTGVKISEILAIGKVGLGGVKFSNDGSVLLVGCKSGSMYVWRTPKSLYNPMLKVLNSIKSNPDFWDNFSILLINQEPRLSSSKKNMKNLRKPAKKNIPKLKLPSSNSISIQKELSCSEEEDLNGHSFLHCHELQENEDMPQADLLKKKLPQIKYSTSDFYEKNPMTGITLCHPKLKKSTYTTFTPCVDVESTQGNSKRSNSFFRLR